MRSSFDVATVAKRVTMTLLVASGALSIMDGCFSESAQADPARGGVSEFIVAQGDAKLPAPDPNYHPKSGLGGDFSGVAAQNNSSDAPSADQMMRRRMRRRLKREAQGNGAQSDGGQTSGGPNASAPVSSQGSGGPVSGSSASGAGGTATGASEYSTSQNQVGSYGARLRARAQANGLSPASGAFGGGAKRFQGGAFAGGNLFGKRALDLTSLNLSPDQKQRIQDTRRQVAPKTKEIRKQLVAKRAELRDMMFQTDSNDDLVRAKRKEVRQLQDKIEDLQLNDFLSIRSVLTPDQRQKLTDLKPVPKVAAGQAPLIAPAVSTQPVP